MERTILDPSYQIITLEPVMSAAECAALIQQVEARGFADAPITTMWGFEMEPDIRNNTRVMFDDPALTARLWERIRDHVPPEQGAWTALGLNERLRFYRYEPGQAFRWHSDGSFRRSAGEESILTFMVYLNQDFTGGGTEFQLRSHKAAPIEVQPRMGMGLLFLHDVLHQGAEVETGRKYVLRSDVMYRRSLVAQMASMGGCWTGK